ncbi:MAG TPA: MarC family protein, partial [Paracoccaceae bacterium]|nr:MarC family protein [Paracoccaceae bacterium]
MPVESIIAIFVTLFVVIDPIGLAPMFVALTAGMDKQRRRAIALRACLVALGILALFGLIGEALLGTIGI